MDNEPSPFAERLEDAIESARVWWFMRDAQEKQVILVAGLYIFASLLEILTAWKRAAIEGGNHA